MKVSVIIPVYNVEKYLRECLESVVEQTFSDIEIICVDDASTDHSNEILNGYAQKDSRIRVVKNSDHLGVSAARNKGIDEANGEYVWFIDADDYIEKGAIERLFDIAISRNLDILAFGFTQEYENEVLRKRYDTSHAVKNKLDEITSGKMYFKECVKNGDAYGVVWCYLFRKEFLRTNRLHFLDGILHEDTLFFVESVLKAQRVKQICDPFYHHRKREYSITTDNVLYEKRIESLCVVAEKVFEYVRGSTEDPELSKQLLRYYECVCRQLDELYCQSDSFVTGFITDLCRTYPFLAPLVRHHYQGYFRDKLNCDEMRSLRQAKYVLIYGAGKVGHAFERLLTERKIMNYQYVVTCSDRDNGIRPICDFVAIEDQCVVVIAVKNEKDEMIRTATELGFHNILVPNE